MMSTSEQLISIPDECTSPTAKLVYLALLRVEEATVGELQRQLGLSKLTLLPILESLRRKDLIRRTEGGYARY